MATELGDSHFHLTMYYSTPMTTDAKHKKLNVIILINEKTVMTSARI